MANNVNREHDPHDDALRHPKSQHHSEHDRSDMPDDAIPAAVRARLEALLAPARAGSSQDYGHSSTEAAEVRMTVDAETLVEVVPALHEHGIAYFEHLFADIATDEGDRGNEAETQRTNTVGGPTLHVLMVLVQRPLLLHLIASLPAGASSYPSLAPRLPAAGWYERELHEETGIIAQGHPRLARLRLPAEWPVEIHPLVGDMPDVLEVTDQGVEESSEARVPLVGLDDERAVLDPGPEGVVDYPLGPVRSGVLESAHYTLRTVGEEIVDARLQLFFKHRGVEQRAAGLTPLHLPLLAERISGTSGFAHALAACQALERAGGVVVPARSLYLRTCFAELERLYNHLGYQADVCQATGLVVGQAQFEILKERVLRLNALLTGHRYLFGACVYGGLARDPAASVLDSLRAELRAIRTKAERLRRMTLGSPSHVDRLERTGRLIPDEARSWATVGPVARASGVDHDLRRDLPYAAYGMVTFDVPVLDDGDALARVRIRMDEIFQSFHILDQVLDELPRGPVCVDHSGPPAPGNGALGWVESPRGGGLHWIQLDADGRVARYRVRTASFANAQAFSLCIPGHNILTDFPVIEQSWGLSSAGADR